MKEKKKLEEQTKELFKQVIDELDKNNFDRAKELLEKTKSTDHHTATSLIRAKERSLLKLVDELIHKGEHEKAEIEIKKVLTLNLENEGAKIERKTNEST